MAGEQGFVTPCFPKFFDIKQLRSILLKTRFFSLCVVKGFGQQQSIS